MNYDNLKIPNHVGIIVDGNGRWATSQGLKRSAGHKKGAENLEKLVLYILSKGIKVVSLYVFSTENFKRSEEEVGYLMRTEDQIYIDSTNLSVDEKVEIIGKIIGG